jgi:hypothetical protein
MLSHHAGQWPVRRTIVYNRANIQYRTVVTVLSWLVGHDCTGTTLFMLYSVASEEMGKQNRQLTKLAKT